MAAYTFHWTFSHNQKTYHIYGASKENKGHAFGGSQNIPGGNFVRMDLLTAPNKTTDHGGDIVTWAKNKAKFTSAVGQIVAQANPIQSPVGIVINCNQGRMRTSLVAILTYISIVNCTKDAALQAYNMAKFSSDAVKLSDHQMGDLKNVLDLVF